MAVGWAPNRLKADPNSAGVNRLDADDILAPHNLPGPHQKDALGLGRAAPESNQQTGRS
jgi:hypothetical protein